MKQSQEEHLLYILDEIHSRTDTKFRKGDAEYGTSLFEDYDVRELVLAAIDEAIDQATYLLTILRKLDEHPEA